MRKRYMLIRSANWQSSFLYQLCRFQNRNLRYIFQTLFALKQGLAHLYFLYENELLQNCLSYDLRKMATLLVLEVRFFQQVRFLGGLFLSVPGSGSVSGTGFQMMPFSMKKFPFMLMKELILGSLSQFIFSMQQVYAFCFLLIISAVTYLVLAKTHSRSVTAISGAFLLNWRFELRINTCV